MVLSHKIQIETNRGEKVFCLADLHMRIDRKVVLKMTQERFPDIEWCASVHQFAGGPVFCYLML